MMETVICSIFGTKYLKIESYNEILSENFPPIYNFQLIHLKLQCLVASQVKLIGFTKTF